MIALEVIASHLLGTEELNSHVFPHKLYYLLRLHQVILVFNQLHHFSLTEQLTNHCLHQERAKILEIITQVEVSQFLWLHFALEISVYHLLEFNIVYFAL